MREREPLGGVFGRWSAPFTPSTIADRHAASYWVEQARAYEASNRIRGDKIERPREELDASRRLSGKLWKRAHKAEAERDEARAVARGLLRLAKAHQRHWMAETGEGELAALRERGAAIGALGQLGPVPEWLRETKTWKTMS